MGRLAIGAMGAAAAILVASGCANQHKAAAEPAMSKPAEAAPKAAAPAPSAGNSARQYFPTGRADSSAIAVEKIAPAEVSVGQAFDYTLKVTNMASSAVENVVVADTMDSGFKMTGSNPKGTVDGKHYTFGLGTMSPGEVKNITISGTAAGSGILTNCATVSYTLPLCVATRIVQPALAISKSITPESILGCDPITMNLEVKNSGTGPATNIKIVDNLPAGLMTMDGKSVFETTIAKLGAGESSKLPPIALKAAKTGKYDNKASASADGNLKAESQTVTTVVRQPVLAISCKTSADTIVLGRDATFTFEVKNTGDAACADAVVSANVPAGATFVSADNMGAAAGNAVSWKLGAVGPGQTRTVSMTIKPTSLASVTANVACRCAAPASTTCQINVKGIPAMLLNGFDDPDPVAIGGTTTYTLTITNQSKTEKLTNAQLTCTLDDAKLMQFVSADNGGTANGLVVSFPAIPVLNANESRTYKIVVKAVGEGQVQVKAEAKSNEITRTLIKTETTNFYK